MSYSPLPSGVILQFGGATAPEGFLTCDGSQVSRTTYAALFAAIGVAHGSGNGTTTFHLPDYRGRILRGVDGAAGRDPDVATRTAANTGGNTGNNVGSVQDDAMQGHYHQLFQTTNGGGSAAGFDYLAKGAGTGFNVNAGIAQARAIVTDGSSGTPRESLETRPKNAYVNYIIKT